MNEERRIVTIYEDEVELTPDLLKKLSAEISKQDDDEIKLLIPKSKLEDLANALDLDIDDLSEEWESAEPDTNVEKTDIPSCVDKLVMKYGNFDKEADEFDADEFMNDSRINRVNKSIRLYCPRLAKFLEISIEYSDDIPVICANLLSLAANKPIYRKKLKSVNDWMKASATVKSMLSDVYKVSAHDSYEYDKELAMSIYDKLINGANADVPENIIHVIDINGGKVDRLDKDVNMIHVDWHIGDFKASNDIYLKTLNTSLSVLAEDIAHAVYKVSAHDAAHDTAHDSWYDPFADAKKMISEARNKEELDKALYLIHVWIQNGEIEASDAEFKRFWHWVDNVYAHINDIVEDTTKDSTKDSISPDEFEDYARMMHEKYPEKSFSELWSIIEKENDIIEPNYSFWQIAAFKYQLNQLFYRPEAKEKINFFKQKIDEMKDASQYWDLLKEIQEAYDQGILTPRDWLNTIDYLDAMRKSLHAKEYSYDDYVAMIKSLAMSTQKLDAYDRLESLFEEIENANLTPEQYDTLCELREQAEQMLDKATDSSNARDKATDSSNVHKVNVADVDIKLLAQVCDMLDEAGIKNSVNNDVLTVVCGASQWRELKIAYPSVLSNEKEQ